MNNLHCVSWCVYNAFKRMPCCVFVVRWAFTAQASDCIRQHTRGIHHVTLHLMQPRGVICRDVNCASVWSFIFPIFNHKCGLSIWEHCLLSSSSDLVMFPLKACPLFQIAPAITCMFFLCSCSKPIDCDQIDCWVLCPSPRTRSTSERDEREMNKWCSQTERPRFGLDIGEKLDTWALRWRL